MYQPRKKDKTSCCVPQCHSRGSDPTLSFHKFPSDESTVTLARFGCQEVISRRNEWIRVLKIERQVSKRMSVCSLHFVRTDYILPDVPRKRKHLKKTAVPSVHLPASNGESSETLGRKKVLKEKQRVYTNFNQKRCGQWNSDVNGANLEGKLSEVLNKAEACRLCSSQFKDSQFAGACKKRLLWNAVPTKFQVYDVQSKKPRPSTKVLLHENWSAEERISRGSVISYSSLEQLKKDPVQSNGMTCSESLSVAGFCNHEDSTEIDSFDCAKIKLSVLLKKRLALAQSKIDQMKLCINQQKLENRKLHCEKDSCLVKNVHSIKHDAVEGDLRAIVLLNRIATYTSGM